MDFHIDAKNQKFGRLSTEIAAILQGKKTPAYNPRLVGSDKVFLKNYHSVILTGRKFRTKLYHRHTGYVGHIKTQTFEQAFTKDPKKVIRATVQHMMPKNFLNKRRIKNLIFVEDKT